MFVATVWGERSDRERMAAPKSLLPEETPALVRGTIFSSVILRMLDRRVVAVADWADMIEGTSPAGCSNRSAEAYTELI